MATTKKPGSDLGYANKTDDTGLPSIELPSGAGTPGETAPGPTVRPVELIDFDNEKLRVNWRKIIDSQRKGVDTDVLKITPPRAKLDPIARGALESLRAKLIERSQSTDQSHGPSLPQDVEKSVRTFITVKGIASEVKKVTDRLNARRITDGRRWVLATAYEFLLADLFHDRADQLKKLIQDDLGVAEKILLELEANGGPLDLFVNLIVESVMERNRIHPSITLTEIVSQQVRAAI